jgi:hypothetical protein
VVRHRVLRLLESRGALPAEGPEDTRQAYQAQSLHQRFRWTGLDVRPPPKKVPRCAFLEAYLTHAAAIRPIPRKGTPTMSPPSVPGTARRYVPPSPTCSPPCATPVCVRHFLRPLVRSRVNKNRSCFSLAPCRRRPEPPQKVRNSNLATARAWGRRVRFPPLRWPGKATPRQAPGVEEERTPGRAERERLRGPVSVDPSGLALVLHHLTHPRGPDRILEPPYLGLGPGPRGDTTSPGPLEGAVVLRSRGPTSRRSQPPSW